MNTFKRYFVAQGREHIQPSLSMVVANMARDMESMDFTPFQPGTTARISVCIDEPSTGPQSEGCIRGAVTFTQGP